MSFTDVMYGGLGQLNNQFQANLGQNVAMNQNQQAAMQQQAAAAAAQQAQLNALYGPQGFGGQTAAYAGAGAAYGRETGYYGDTWGLSPGNAPKPGAFETGAPAFNDFGSGADQAWYLGGSQGPRPSDVWSQGATPYNDYGGGANPGGFSPSPNYPGGNYSPISQYNNGGFNPYSPQTFAPAAQGNVGSGFAGPAQFGGPQDVAWMQGGSQGDRPSDMARPGWGGAADQAWVQGGSIGERPSLSGGGSSFDDRFSAAPSVDYNLQGSPSGGLPRGIFDGSFNTQTPNSPPANFNERFGIFGGPEDVSWMLGGSQGSRPSSVNGWGGAADQAWVQGGSQGQRPSLMASGGDTSWLGAGGTQNPYNPFGQINSGQVGNYDAFGGPADVAWMQAGSNGPRPSTANPNFQQGGGFGMGSAFDPATYGGSTGNPGFSFDQRFPVGASAGSPGFGNYPQQPMASDNMANQQQMIQDLYKTLGIIDNAGEFNRGDGAYNPSGNTLRPGDYQHPFVNLPGG